jgi:hypothetical protein
VSKRSNEFLAGRNDGNIKIIFPNGPLDCNGRPEKVLPGHYVAVKVAFDCVECPARKLIVVCLMSQVHDANSQVLKGTGLYHTTLSDFYRTTDVVTSR